MHNIPEETPTEKVEEKGKYCTNVYHATKYLLQFHHRNYPEY